MMPLDSVHTFETPEGVELSLRIAGPLVRALAWVLDALIRYVILVVIYLVLMIAMPQSGLAIGIFLILLFLMEWFYPVIFEVTRGATPGKKAMGLLVVHDNGTPISWPASMIRNLLRVVDFFPVFYGAGLVSMLINRQFKRLGDLAAGTLVVYAEQARSGDAMIHAQPLPLPIPLAIEDQRALLDFAERSTTLTPARVEELAEIITTERGPAAVQTVLGYAHWLARGR